MNDICKPWRLEKLPDGLPGPEVGEVYQHYKGGLYQVVGVGIVVGDFRPVYKVTYRDFNDDETNGLCYTRNLYEFDNALCKPPWMSYTVDGKPRFEHVTIAAQPTEETKDKRDFPTGQTLREFLDSFGPATPPDMVAKLIAERGRKMAPGSYPLPTPEFWASVIAGLGEKSSAPCDCSLTTFVFGNPDISKEGKNDA